MKYIRTEYGHIYEYIEQRIHPSQYQKFGLYRHNLNSEYEQIIDQADTIKELCDRFIVETEDIPEFWVEPTLENAKMYYEIKNIYGAIWVIDNNGFPTLRPVAKMNEKGDLELI